MDFTHSEGTESNILGIDQRNDTYMCRNIEWRARYFLLVQSAIRRLSAVAGELAPENRYAQRKRFAFGAPDRLEMYFTSAIYLLYVPKVKK